MIPVSVSPSIVQPPVTPYPACAEGSCRRVLQAELCGIREVLAKCPMDDEMTRQIDLWQTNFAKALKSNEDAQIVGSAYIALLQEMLRDPIIQAPLDLYAVLGSDGQTYGRMSLTVYLLTVPAPYRNKSPMDPSSSIPFTTSAHPVVRHMIQWLQNHDAMLYSQEVERAFLDLLPSQRTLPTVQTKKEEQIARINRIQARQAELDRMEAEERNKQSLAFDRKLQERLRRRGEELEQMTAPLRQRAELAAAVAHRRLDGLEHRDRENLDRAQEDLKEMAQNERNNKAELRMDLDRVNEAHRDAIREHERQLEPLSAEALRKCIEQRMKTEFEPLSCQVQDFVDTTLKQIGEMAQNDTVFKEKLDKSIKHLQGEIATLHEGNQMLHSNQNKLTVQINEVKIQDAVVKQGICETKAAISAMQERNANRILNTVLMIGACALGTWALQAWANSLGAASQAAFIPSKGGIQMSGNIYF